jgi:hypothetical protein
MASPSNPARLTPTSSYLFASTRPLHILCFLLPFLLAYEIGSIVYLRGQGVNALGARRMLALFFELFGVTGLSLPPLIVGVVLIAWHLIARDSSRVRWRVLAGMALESCAWVVPLLVLSLALATRAVPAAAGWAAPTWQARLTVALGAGLYEELLFRLLLITVTHLILADLLSLPGRTASVLASIVSTGAFVFLHHLYPPPGPGMSLRAYVFFALAGFYFAVVFLTRGFGIVVGVHAIYDAVVLLTAP